MSNNILVIGGSYFAGRIFSLQSTYDGHKITVLNRGRYSMKEVEDKIDEVKCDRRDAEALKKADVAEHYDAIVDFCAYEPGDIKVVFENLPCKFDQYIYISTPNMLAPSKEVRDENSPVITEEPEGEVGAYSWKKLQLENELKDVAEATNVLYTILRPAFIFGPYNYAPRESFYVENIVKNGAIPQPTNATGKFNMVYVKDVALAIMGCIGNEKAYNKTYFASAPDELTYDKFVEVLKEVADREFELIPMSVQDILSQEVPLPFPLTEDENELYDGSKLAEDTGINYSNFKENMEKTYEAFVSVYSE